jgi:hypothetical protein
MRTLLRRRRWNLLNPLSFSYIGHPAYKNLESQLQQAVVNRLQDSSKAWFIEWIKTHTMKDFSKAFRVIVNYRNDFKSF